jgi:hypothetical protein
MTTYETTGGFKPVFSEAHEDEPEGWYIECESSVDEDGFPMVWSLKSGEMFFQSQRDALLAIAAFHRAGISTDEQMSVLSDMERKRIAYSALPW